MIFFKTLFVTDRKTHRIHAHYLLLGVWLLVFSRLYVEYLIALVLVFLVLGSGTMAASTTLVPGSGNVQEAVKGTRPCRNSFQLKTKLSSSIAVLCKTPNIPNSLGERNYQRYEFPSLQHIFLVENLSVTLSKR